MKTRLLVITLLLSLIVDGTAQKRVAGPAKPGDAGPCVPRRAPKWIKPPAVSEVVPSPVEPAAEFFIGEAMVEVTKDQTVIKLAMAQHASVLIELPANDGPRYIIPGDPEMVTVDEKALERNKRAIIVRPGSLFVVPVASQRKRTPAATVTAQMRSGLVVTFLFYPVSDLAQNVHRCVLSYKRDDVVARRRAAGLPVNLDQKEQGGERRQSGAPASIFVEPAEEAKAPNGVPANNSSGLSKLEDPSKRTCRRLSEVEPNASPVSDKTAAPLLNVIPYVNERAIAAAKEQLARAPANQSMFKNWTRPLHGLALAVQQDGDLKEDFRVLLLAVRNAGTQPLRLIPGTPELTLEMHDDKGKLINVQSIKPLYTEASKTGSEVGAGRLVYYVIAYKPPLMGVRHQLKVVVAQSNAADEPASIALLQ